MCFLFQRLGVLHVGQRIEEQADFEKIYKNGRLFIDFKQWLFLCREYITSLIFLIIFLFTAWADNANACAKQYAGTGALKTDYTRQVSISCKGLLGF